LRFKNHVIKRGSDQNGPSSSHRPLKLRNSEHVYSKIRVIQIMFKYSSIELQSLRFYEMHVVGELTMLEE